MTARAELDVDPHSLIYIDSGGNPHRVTDSAWSRDHLAPHDRSILMSLLLSLAYRTTHKIEAEYSDAKKPATERRTP